MIFDRKEQKPTAYSYEQQLNHKRHLDDLKQEFLKIYNNPIKYDCTADDYDVVQIIGVGSFGTVFLVRDKITLLYNAMKAFDKNEVIKKKNIKQVTQEKKILQCITFPFLISLKCSCKDNLYLYLIFPFEAGGELFNLIKKMGNLSEPLAQFYAAQMVLALEYLHHCGLVHRDVKPENIMINESGYIKLGDFGFCKAIKNRTWTICGTPEYIAPEIILSKGYTYSVDWWSLGVLIFEMSAGYPPFYHSETMKLYEKIISGIYKCPINITSNCKTLIKHLLDTDPSKRFGSLKAGVYDIKSHVWFVDINWSVLLHQKMCPPFIPVLKCLGDTSNFPKMSDVKLKKTYTCLFEKEFENF